MLVNDRQIANRLIEIPLTIFVILVNVDEPLTEEQRNERVAIRNNNARRQLIPRSDVPQTEGRREPARYVIERSNSPVVEEDDDESKSPSFQSLLHHHLIQRVLNLVLVISYSIQFYWPKHQLSAIGMSPSLVTFPY